MIRRPPRSTRTDTLFPYTTLFRSGGATEDAIARIAVREDETLDLRQPVAHDRIVDPADLLRKLNELRELLAQPVGAADAGALVLQRRAADIPALAALRDLPSQRGLDRQSGVTGKGGAVIGNL